jgi:hypothetical protein
LNSQLSTLNSQLENKETNMKFSRLLTILLIAGIFMACPNNLDPDKLPWAVEVRDLEVKAYSGGALLSWTNPEFPGFDGVEITYTPDGGAAQTVTGVKGTNNWRLGGLSDGTAYAFTVKAVDKDGGKSAGLTGTATPTSGIPEAPYPVEVLKLTAIAGDIYDIGNGGVNYRPIVYLTWQKPQDSNTTGQIRITSNHDFISGNDGKKKILPAGDGRIDNNNFYAYSEFTPSQSAVGVLPVYINSSQGNYPFFPTAEEYWFMVQMVDKQGKLSDGVKVYAPGLIGEMASFTAESTATTGEVKLKAAAPIDSTSGSPNIGAYNFATAVEGVQISVSPAVSGFPKDIAVGHADYTALTGGGLSCSGFQNGVSYTFTIKTYDTVASGATYYTSGVTASVMLAPAITGASLAVNAGTAADFATPAELKAAISGAAINANDTLKLTGLPLDSQAWLIALYQGIGAKNTDVKLDFSGCSSGVYTGVPSDTASDAGRAKIVAVTLPETVTELRTTGQYGAFYDFTRLASLDARGLAKIGDYSFFNCDVLGVGAYATNYITLGSEPPVLGNQVFQGTPASARNIRARRAGITFNAWYERNKEKFRPAAQSSYISLSIRVYDAIDIPAASIKEGAVVDLTVTRIGIPSYQTDAGKGGATLKPDSIPNERDKYGYKFTAGNESAGNLAGLAVGNFNLYEKSGDNYDSPTGTALSGYTVSAAALEGASRVEVLDNTACTFPGNASAGSRAVELSF